MRVKPKGSGATFGERKISVMAEDVVMLLRGMGGSIGYDLTFL